MGYRVILDAGMTAMEVEFPDADCYAFKDGYLKVGEGHTDDIGRFQGNQHGVFRSGKVAGVVDMSQ